MIEILHDQIVTYSGYNTPINQKLIRRSLSMNKKEPLQWHPAFCCAMRLALREEKGLEYIDEYNLTDKPLQIDLMIVKKQKNDIIHNCIGKIFKKHNIIEYKSPEDKLNINTFYKSMAYACLYQSSPKHTEPIYPADITVSLIRDRKPTKLINTLTNLGFNVTQAEKGIYRIHNSLFDTQIIVTSNLDITNNNWLKSLCTNISKDLYLSLYNDIQNNFNDTEKSIADPVIQLVSTANQDIIKAWKEDNTMCQALKEIMKEEITESFNDGFKKGELQSKIKTYYECGITPEEIAEKIPCSLEYVNEVLGI